MAIRKRLYKKYHKKRSFGDKHIAKIAKAVVLKQPNMLWRTLELSGTTLSTTVVKDELTAMSAGSVDNIGTVGNRLGARCYLKGVEVNLTFFSSTSSTVNPIAADIYNHIRFILIKYNGLVTSGSPFETGTALGSTYAPLDKREDMRFLCDQMMTLSPHFTGATAIGTAGAVGPATYHLKKWIPINCMAQWDTNSGLGAICQKNAIQYQMFSDSTITPSPFVTGYLRMHFHNLV